jgi:hypothetical protein
MIGRGLRPTSALFSNPIRVSCVDLFLEASELPSSPPSESAAAEAHSKTQVRFNAYFVLNRMTNSFYDSSRFEF